MSTTLIYTHLKTKGIDVYFPSQAIGDVVEPRVVVKADGTSKFNGFSTMLCIYDVMCYVPKDRYSTLEEFVSQVREFMKELEPRIMPTHFETSDFYDDSVKGHMVSIQYRNYKKI